MDTLQTGIVLNDKARNQLSGSILEGYSYHIYINDAATAEMTGMLGEKVTWTPSGANLSGATGGPSTTFEAGHQQQVKVLHLL